MLVRVLFFLFVSLLACGRLADRVREWTFPFAERTTDRCLSEEKKTSNPLILLQVTLTRDEKGKAVSDHRGVRGT